MIGHAPTRDRRAKNGRRTPDFSLCRISTSSRSCPPSGKASPSPSMISASRQTRGGSDTSVIALWLGHENIETTQVYLHADLAIKERALARTKPAETQPGRFRPTDRLLAFLEAL